MVAFGTATLCQIKRHYRAQLQYLTYGALTKGPAGRSATFRSKAPALRLSRPTGSSRDYEFAKPPVSSHCR